MFYGKQKNHVAKIQENSCIAFRVSKSYWKCDEANNHFALNSCEPIIMCIIFNNLLSPVAAQLHSLM